MFKLFDRFHFLQMIPQKKHIRLKDFDYSTNGYYFITICTKNKEHFFGKMEIEIMNLNNIGNYANNELKNLPQHFTSVKIDEYVVMPNHIHCIIILDDSETHLSRVTSFKPLSSKFKPNQFSKPNSGSVSLVIQQYKANVKRWCNKNNHGQFEWQPRFHDRLIRNEEEYKYIKQYILENSENWNKDRFNEDK
ncbi:transposase [soil metagenome]